MRHKNDTSDIGFFESNEIEILPVYDDTLARLSGKLIELDKFVYRELEVDLLSHEFRLAIQLIHNPAMTVKDATLSSRLSGRAFHDLLKRLESVSIIELSRSSEDGRSKHMKLSDHAIEKMVTCDALSELLGVI